METPTGRPKRSKVILPPALRRLPAQPRNSRGALVEMLSSAIAEDALPADLPLPSCRALAAEHGMSKNTAQSAYDHLVELGLVTPRPRSGYFVAPAARRMAISLAERPLSSPLVLPAPLPSELPRVRHPEDWISSPYPFVYNQIDPSLFPVEAWRECTRLALSRRGLNALTADDEAGDNPNLIAQLRKRLLAHRGITSSAAEVMVTLGTQNAISLTGLLLRAVPGVVAVEDPGYPDARNAFNLTGNAVAPVPVDDEGIIVDLIPKGCKLVHVTPSHHFPTSVTLSLSRRHDLLALAEERGLFIFEDDYEADLEPTNSLPTLRSLDRAGRVIYASSLSKTLSPGLRLGFMVAPPDIISQAKALRHAMIRHAPTLVQETAALLIGLGHYDAHLRKISREMDRRRNAMRDGIAAFLPMFHASDQNGGSSFWLRGEEGFDSETLAMRLEELGVIIDPGRIFFSALDQRRYFRLGFAAIPSDQISDGLQRIALAYSRSGGV